MYFFLQNFIYNIWYRNQRPEATYGNDPRNTSTCVLNWRELGHPSSLQSSESQNDD